MNTHTNEKKISMLPIVPHYAAKTKNGWGVEMQGTEAVDGSNIDHAGVIGIPMTNFTIEGEGIKGVRIKNKRGRWLDYKTGFNTDTGVGDDSGILAIEIVGKGFIASVHIMGGTWLNSVNTSDIEGAVTIGINVPIDAIWVDRI